MKTWMKVVLGIIAGIVVLVGFVFWLTGDITKTGDEFFAAIQNDDIDGAYALLSDDFRAGVSKDDLKAYLAANALDKIKETSWGGRAISGGTGSLEGTVTTVGGSKIPLKLGLIDSDSGWQINTIEKQTAGFQSSDNGNPLPSPDKQQQLFSSTVAVFAASLADQNMQKLLDYSSSVLREQVTLAEFNSGFASFFPYAEASLGLISQRPIIDDASIDEGTGVLTIRGHYPTTPEQVHFRQTYVYQGIDWKLLGLYVKIGSPPK